MQMKIGAIGIALTGLEDLNQEIGLIWGTPLGSIPHMLWYGSKIYQYTDKPENIARPLIVAEAFRSLKVCCSRFTPTKIKLLSASPSGKMLFKVNGIPNDPEIDKEFTLSILADFSSLRAAQ